jgi:hypothetical protein
MRLYLKQGTALVQPSTPPAGVALDGASVPRNAAVPLPRLTDAVRLSWRRQLATERKREKWSVRLARLTDVLQRLALVGWGTW